MDRPFRLQEPVIETPNIQIDPDSKLLEKFDLVDERKSNQTHETKHDEIFIKSKANNSKRYKNTKLTPYHEELVSRLGYTYETQDNDADAVHDRPRFRQTYTEVSLPMKTSPAFEYILKDNRRRNKRCCMLLLYTVLVTLGIATIIFCCAHLIVRRYQNSP